MRVIIVNAKKPSLRHPEDADLDPERSEGEREKDEGSKIDSSSRLRLSSE
jgi:hypothetical protein